MEKSQIITMNNLNFKIDDRAYMAIKNSYNLDTALENNSPVLLDIIQILKSKTYQDYEDKCIDTVKVQENNYSNLKIELINVRILKIG